MHVQGIGCAREMERGRRLYATKLLRNSRDVLLRLNLQGRLLMLTIGNLRAANGFSISWDGLEHPVAVGP